jgi:CRISPR/Cas system-associated protein Cas10 (large subunit of type III CRISPR-Cas system)
MNAKERKKEVEVEEEEEAQGKERTERTERGFDHRTQTLRARLCSAFHVLTRRTQKKVNSFCSRDLITINLSLSLKREFAFSQTRAIRELLSRKRECVREEYVSRALLMRSISHAIDIYVPFFPSKWSKKKNRRFILSLKKFTYSSSCVIVHS